MKQLLLLLVALVVFASPALARGGGVRLQDCHIEGLSVWTPN